MQISILGIDVGKNGISVIGVDDQGAVILRRTLRRFVELKSQEHPDIQTLHRVRSRRVAERTTTLINPLRAILLERSVVCRAPEVRKCS